jgi:pyruvate kinase
VETIQVEKIQRLRVEPGETLVVTMPRHSTAENVSVAAKVIRERVPDGVEVLVVSGGIELSVIERAPEPTHS